jgi:hypothetical protein
MWQAIPSNPVRSAPGALTKGSTPAAAVGMRRGAVQRQSGSEAVAGRRITGTAYGPQPIREPRATLPEALGQSLKAAAYRALPIASRAALQMPRQGSAVTYPEQVVGIRSVSTKISDPEGWQAAADKREIAEWERALKAQNADRARRGLPPLPAWQPARPFNPTGRYWMGQ